MSNLQDVIAKEIEAARNKRNKMLFIVLRQASRSELHRAIERLGIPKLNLGLQLSEQLRFLSPQKRPFKVGRLLRSLIAQEKQDILCLDRIEYLFDTELKQNPVRLFESLSGNRTLVILWPGTLDNGTLIYATPEHPEYYQSDGSYSSYAIEV